MDTSTAWNEACAMRNRLVDRSTIVASTIPPTAWILALEAILNEQAWISTRIHGLFAPIADIMSGNHKYVSIRAPRGLTKFPQGLSFTNRVLPVRYSHQHSGNNFTELGRCDYWSQNQDEYLLLLEPVRGERLKWALWSVGYRTSMKADRYGWEHVAYISELKLCEEDTVLAVLADFHVPCAFINLLYRELQGYAREAKSVVELARFVEQIWSRIKE